MISSSLTKISAETFFQMMWHSQVLGFGTWTYLLGGHHPAPYTALCSRSCFCPHLTDKAKTVRPLVLDGTASVLQSWSGAQVVCVVCLTAEP